MEFDGEMAFGGIFLTLDGEEPQDPRYAPITYETVIQVLSRCIEQNAYLLTAEVKTFLQHYVEIIEEEVGLSAERSDMERLARQLYRENKKVLDFIISTGGGSDFSIAAEHFFGEDLTKNQEIEIEGQRLLFNQLDQKVVSFLPDSWYRPLSDIEWAGCEKWWSGFPLIAWFQLWPDAKGTSGTLGLYGEVGPISDYSLRRDLIQAIQQSAEETGTIRIKFQQAAANEGKRYSKFFNKNFRSIKDVQDAAEITDVMTKLFREFRPEFDLVGAAVQRFAAGRDAKV